MTTTPERFITWADSEPSITMVTLIGSRARPNDAPDGPTQHSDWDFQIGTTNPAMFATADWLSAIAATPIAYVKRLGVTGVVDKVTAVFEDGDVEWVVIPAEPLAGIAHAVAANAVDSDPMIGRMLAELGKVLFGHYRILKGESNFAELYRTAQALGGNAFRLSDAAVASLANGFVCDYVSVRRKIDRGELHAAQLLLFSELVEPLYSLLFELRSREGLHVKPLARRLEELGDPRLPMLTFQPGMDAGSLEEATVQAAEALRTLTHTLIGAQWSWPDLSPINLT